jgi:subtilase family serine protease
VQESRISVRKQSTTKPELQTEYSMRSWKFLLPLLATSLCFAAQPDRITSAINSNQTVALAKSLHPKAKPQYDQGPVDPSLKLSYMTMLMAPSPSQQKALDQLLAEQQDRESASYHKWLTPQQFADQFGLSQNDLNKVTGWLKSRGFQILSVGGSRNTISFNGTAAQAESAFRTEIHNYNVDGEVHFANSTPVMIPSVLNGIVSSVLGLHSFLPKPASQGRGARGVRSSHSNYYVSGFVFPNFLAPDDIATIYDITPLYTASTPIDGSGQTLGIIGQTDVYLADLNDFRSGFNLNQITGCTTNTSGVISACNSTYFQYVAVGTDPGTTYNCGDLSEADLDLEWSGAVARNAQIVFFNSPIVYDTNCNYVSGGGVNAALTQAISPTSGSPLAKVLSMSYGTCEAGAAPLESLLQQGNAEGITIVNSAGDQGAAACDFSPPGNAVQPPFGLAQNGFAVTYPASSPEVTGVGGTSISLANDSYPTQSSYWSTSLGPNGGTAESYIPEQPWNDDEAFADYCHNPISGDTFCSTGGGVQGWVALSTSATAAQVQTDIWISSGGGGASNCWYVNSSGVCLGSGAGPSGGGFPRPSYQQSLVVPSAPAGVRYVPDVSLMSSPDFPGYIYCTPESELENTTSTASSCAGGILNAINNANYVSVVGGTSAASPVFAGIVTLLNQAVGGSQGSFNPTLYKLAATPSNGVFHAIASGDNDVYCSPNTPAGFPANVLCPGSGVVGFSVSNADATTGYNLVTGLGSVDVNKLASALSPFTITAGTLVPSSIPAGQSSTVTLTVTPVNPSSGLTISFSNTSGCAGLPTNGTCTFNPTSVNGASSQTVQLTILTPANMAKGTLAITVSGTASGTSSGSATTPVSLPVTATNQSFAITSTGATFSVAAGATASVPITVNAPITGGANSPISFVNTTNTSTALPVTYTCLQSSIPSEATCTFSPSSGNAVSRTSLTLSIATTAPTAQLRRPPLERGSHIFYALLLPGLFGIVFGAVSRNRSARLLGLIVVLGFSTLGLGSCGSSNSSSGGQSSPGTPAGSYTVVVNATTAGPNALTATPLKITLTVTN